MKHSDTAADIIEPFSACLAGHGLSLIRQAASTLQINVGLTCNLACRHCHHAAGPGRGEVMDRRTMEAVTAYARKVPFKVIDVTGGAPELVPGIDDFLSELAPLSPRLMFRSNLTALNSSAGNRLVDRLVSLGVIIFASFPSTHAPQADAQRGDGTFDASIEMLRYLNGQGYGVAGSGLELNLVANPGGAFLPVGQQAAERRFRQELERRHGVTFNNLFTFANVPLGRFRDWLERSGNLNGYLERLAANFNPCTVAGLMCRSQVTVDWQGYLYDCDFNIAAGRPLGGRRLHVSELTGPPPEDVAVVTADYCYACTAGAGFTCGGAIAPP